MGSLERKLSRKKGNKGKKDAEKEMATKVALFDKLPDHCLTCEKSFNRMDKEQVQSWSVVVREQEERANLYCPDCWQKAIGIVKDFKQYLEKKNKS